MVSGKTDGAADVTEGAVDGTLSCKVAENWLTSVLAGILLCLDSALTGGICSMSDSHAHLSTLGRPSMAWSLSPC